MRRHAAGQLAIDRSRRAGQQRYFALESHVLPPASLLVGGMVRYFACWLHRRAAVRARDRDGRSAPNLAISYADYRSRNWTFAQISSARQTSQANLSYWKRLAIC